MFWVGLYGKYELAAMVFSDLTSNDVEIASTVLSSPFETSPTTSVAPCMLSSSSYRSLTMQMLLSSPTPLIWTNRTRILCSTMQVSLIWTTYLFSKRRLYFRSFSNRYWNTPKNSSMSLRIVSCRFEYSSSASSNDLWIYFVKMAMMDRYRLPGSIIFCTRVQLLE